MRMLRSLAIVVLTGVAILGGVATAANAAPTAAAITCGNHEVHKSGNTVVSYYGNCASHAVEIDVEAVTTAPPGVVDVGDRCVAAGVDQVLGTIPNDTDGGAYLGSVVGTC